jgi:sodium ion-translocating decarboxylase beta subunit
MEALTQLLTSVFLKMGVIHLTIGHIIMWLVAFFFLYLAVKKEYEPLLLLPIGFGIFLVNLPLAPLMGKGELFWIFHHYGIEWEVIPCVIFLGLGVMTDFGPMLANPKSLLVGAGAQLGVFVTFLGSYMIGFTLPEAASVAIIGGADGPTTIYLTNALAPQLIGPNALAAYSYMAMVPLILPPIVNMLTSKKERQIEMKQMREVSHTEKLLFPIFGTIVIGLMIPSILPLLGMLMLGNFMRETGVVSRLSKTAEGSLMNIVTIFLGVSVGATMDADNFLNARTLSIFALGIFDFILCTAGGVLMVKLMNLFSKDKMNPIIGAAGLSAVPMAARVAQGMGKDNNPKNFLLMHAMGCNVAGVVGTAAAAGLMIAMFK